MTFGAPWMVAMLFELGERVLHSCPRDSYLSPARILLHLVASDLRRLSPLVPDAPEPDYGNRVAALASDFPAMDTTGFDVVTVLQSHLAYRRARWARPFEAPGFLEEPIADPHFTTKGDVLGHMIWHWSFHSGHLGAVTLEQGYEYLWTTQTRAASGTGGVR